MTCITIAKAVVYRFFSPSFLAMWTCWCLRGVDAWLTDQVSANGDMMDARKSMYSTAAIYPKLGWQAAGHAAGITPSCHAVCASLLNQHEVNVTTEFKLLKALLT
jgi:hypothetical protein